MTIQTKLTWKQGFLTEVKSFMKTAVVLVVCCFALSFGTTKATSPSNSMALTTALSGTTVQGSVSLSEAASNPTLSIAIDPVFAAAYPSAVFTANMEPDNQTIAVTILNAPTRGIQDVGSITVADDSGADIAVVSVGLKDGILEMDISEF